jgi:alkylhydroperoxidase family enzyme
LSDAADPATAAAALSGTRNDLLTKRERALVEWARKVVRDPGRTTSADVGKLREAGFSEKEIFEATVLMAFRVAFSMVNNALGVNPDRQVAEAAPAEVREVITYGRPAAAQPS